MLLQKFVRENGLEAVKQLGIRVSRHKKYPNLCNFCYLPSTFDWSNPILHEARGVILDEDNNWAVVSWPFEKFFNHAEKWAAQLNPNFKVLSKLDGSMIILSKWCEEWIASTKGSADAGGTIQDGSMTFSDLFWRTWHDLGYWLPKEGMTYCFEMTSPKNRIVVDYDVDLLTLVAVRNLETGREEFPTKVAYDYGWQSVKPLNFNSVDAVKSYCSRIKGNEEEGFVLVDLDFNRVKIKAEDYLRRHRLLSLASDREVMLAILKGQGDDVRGQDARLDKAFEEMEARLKRFEERSLAVISEVSGVSDRKELAQKLKGNPFAAVVFCLRDGKISSPIEFLTQKAIAGNGETAFRFLEGVE